jgi:segregation and condensation protein A
VTEYKVAIDVYNGPLDLMLYLIRREEIDIHDIPIARVTKQYVEYVELLQQLDPDAVSEFLVLAATLMEIKSRTLLPHMPDEEGEEDIVDPRLELVRQLLEYKKFKDAARHLDEAAEQRAHMHARAPVRPEVPQGEVDLDDVDIWTLFDAFNRLLEQTGKGEAVHRVGIDDTPIALHAEDILDSLDRAGGSQAFEDIFGGRSRPEMIGLFLALLELIKGHRVRAGQEESFGTILLYLLDRTPLGEEIVDEYQATPTPAEHNDETQ